MSTKPKTPPALDLIVDRVLAYRPKPKSEPAKRRAKARRKVQRDSKG